jgi:hypothetical protein
MGRRPYSDRLTTKDCKQISASLLHKHHFFDGGVRSGVISWGRDAEKVEKITFVVSTIEGQEYIRFQYTHTDVKSGQKTDRIFVAGILSTPCNYGGRRWWFICPIFVNDYVCKRRVNILYFGKNGNSFGCRHCLDLTYESQKENHKFDKMFLNWELDMQDRKEIRNILSKDRDLRRLFSLRKQEDNWLRRKERWLPKLLKPRRTKKNESKKMYKEKGNRH